MKSVLVEGQPVGGSDVIAEPVDVSLGPGGEVLVAEQRRLYRTTADDVQIIASVGQIPPGAQTPLAPDDLGGTAFPLAKAGEGGHVLFSGFTLDLGFYTVGLWKAAPDGTTEVVVIEEYDRAAGSGLIVKPGEAVINSRGQVAFVAGAYGTIDGIAQEKYGIWAQDEAGDLIAVAYRGQSIDVSDDPSRPDLRTIEQVSSSSGRIMGISDEAFNDRGQIAFFARFTDGTSGVFVSDAVAIPEPASLLGIVLLSLAMKRR